MVAGLSSEFTCTRFRFCIFDMHLFLWGDYFAQSFKMKINQTKMRTNKHTYALCVKHPLFSYIIPDKPSLRILVNDMTILPSSCMLHVNEEGH